MKEIVLNNNMISQVDDEDFEYLNQFFWKIFSTKSGYYCRAKIGNERFLMHRLIAKSKHYQVTDHKDRNGLNNQKFNLRTCTNSQNNCNTKLNSNNTTGFRGVYFDKKRKKFTFRLSFENIKYSGTRFNSAKEAAKARDEVAKKVHGEFATLNNL